MAYQRIVIRRLARPGRRDTVLVGSGLIAGAAVAALVASLLWPSAATESAAAAVPKPDPEPQTNEIFLHVPQIRIGELTYQPLRMACGVSEVVGSHAEWPAKGQFCEIRGTVGNWDAQTHEWDSSKTELLTTDGRKIPMSVDAMEVKRQPDQLVIGSEVHYEFDVYYDVPRDATVKAIVIDDAEQDPTATVQLPVRTWPFI